MKIRFCSGIAPLVRDAAASRRFYQDALGLPLDDAAGYPMTDDLPGLKHFGLWTLEGAAESCFGAATWLADVPVPQANLEFDVERADAVGPAAEELAAKGYRPLVGPKTEPWGQTVARLLSPEGLLVGVTSTPWLHEGAADDPAATPAPAPAPAPATGAA